MFEPRTLSKMIRMKKKKAMNASDLVHSDAKVDMNPMDLYTLTNRLR